MREFLLEVGRHRAWINQLMDDLGVPDIREIVFRFDSADDLPFVCFVVIAN